MEFGQNYNILIEILSNISRNSSIMTEILTEIVENFGFLTDFGQNNYARTVLKEATYFWHIFSAKIRSKAYFWSIL